MSTPGLTDALLDWYRRNRRDLPWRRTHDPYHIWLSEIMLQQTRGEAVKGYYARFLERFPTVEALAAAPESDVLKAWEGLGYYSRARNLQKAARQIVSLGAFPTACAELLALPGVGAYTAGAIASIAFGENVPAIDGNVYRVSTRYFGVRDSVSQPSTQRAIRALVATAMPADAPGDFNQAMMELGATVCLPGKPRCEGCPLRDTCAAFFDGDAELLPVHDAKPAPKTMDVAVCLLTYRDQVLVIRRQQRMLHGLYVFDLFEDVTGLDELAEAIAAQGLQAAYGGELGTARHVFTHRVWEMRILRYRLQKAPSDEALAALEGRMASLNELASLPFPTAMKVAREKAVQLLASGGATDGSPR